MQMCYAMRHHETPHITGHYETPSDNIEHGETHSGRVTGMSFIVGSLNLGHCVNLHVYKCYNYNTYHVHTPGYKTCIYMYCRNIWLVVFFTLLHLHSK